MRSSSSTDPGGDGDGVTDAVCSGIGVAGARAAPVAIPEDGAFGVNSGASNIRGSSSSTAATLVGRTTGAAGADAAGADAAGADGPSIASAFGAFASPSGFSVGASRASRDEKREPADIEVYDTSAQQD